MGGLGRCRGKGCDVHEFAQWINLRRLEPCQNTTSSPSCIKQKSKRSRQMTSSLEKLIEQARQVRMTEPQKVEQRISFAYGTTKIENENVTREMVSRAVGLTKS